MATTDNGGETQADANNSDGADNDDNDDDDDYLEPVNLDELSVGIYVAVDKAEWSNRPLIGKVHSIGDDFVNINWLDGSYNGTFRDSYVGSGANRRPWSENIDKRQIVMIDVQFTNSRRIRKEDIDELKARYEMLEVDNERNTDSQS